MMGHAFCTEHPATNLATTSSVDALTPNTKENLRACTDIHAFASRLRWTGLWLRHQQAHPVLCSGHPLRRLLSCSSLCFPSFLASLCVLLNQRRIVSLKAQKFCVTERKSTVPKISRGPRSRLRSNMVTQPLHSLRGR